MYKKVLWGGILLSLAIVSPITTHAKIKTHEESYTIYPGHEKTIELSYEDANKLMKIAKAEAGNQGIKGQLLVMRVVWNRVKSPNFPDTVEGVLSQKSQFESYSNGSYQKAEPDTDTHLALAEFEKNNDPDTEIIGFETVVNKGALLKYFDYAYTFGDHDFYKEKAK